ncbi:DNA methyltransferase family protein [Hymenobacter pini]|uniref:hypothetical protein n=1 Tax=Hymenobacter pini TaxID=2880879 RepID=UPI001CF3C515|nr:hypothetical protein [Hymenobacter pini]MCA8830311.1 hypothetical protein [Hymenobacter pini]
MPVPPVSILEPTCGVGNLLVAAADEFPEAQTLIGAELSPIHIATLQAIIEERTDKDKFQVKQQNYFTCDWEGVADSLSSPLLVLGNPPWVTNSELSVLGSGNKPVRVNFQNFSGLDALTGRSNFDISEWMLLDMLRWMSSRDATLAILVKTAVAHKGLVYGWKNGLNIHNASIYHINASEHFKANVNACLMVCRTFASDISPTAECQVFDSLYSVEPATSLAYKDGKLVTNTENYDHWSHLQSEGKCSYKWRSGIKHDCTSVMELKVQDNSGAISYINGLNEEVNLENTYLWPMFKSSEVNNENILIPTRRMLVPQQTTGEGTDVIKDIAPKTWAYLVAHGERLDSRKSMIYKKRPRFSVFGVGLYSFSSWKVAISGLYKRFKFKVIGPFEGKGVVLDDTTYFLSCNSEAEANLIADMLNSEISISFFSSFIYWDAKRPITSGLLQRLDIRKLAEQLGKLKELDNVNALHENLNLVA